jgi:hypothetical protein
VLAVLAVLLSLAGAPTGTPVTCDAAPITVFAGADTHGVTWFDASGTPLSVELEGNACLAALYVGATPAQRLAMRSANPERNWARIVGQGLLTIVHESFHVGLRSQAECDVENHALAKLPSVLNRYLPRPSAKPQPLRAARTADPITTAAAYGQARILDTSFRAYNHCAPPA